MTKGKPWTREQEKELVGLVKAKYSLPVLAEKLGKSKEAVRQKMLRLKLEEVEQNRSVCSTTSQLRLPKSLPSIEEALQMLAGALRMACERGLDKVEVQRLQVVATLARTYKEVFSDYIDYRGVEAHLLELDRKYEELAKAAKDNAA